MDAPVDTYLCIQVSAFDSTHTSHTRVTTMCDQTQIQWCNTRCAHNNIEPGSVIAPVVDMRNGQTTHRTTKKKNEWKIHLCTFIVLSAMHDKTRQENQVPISGKIFCLTFNQLFVEFVFLFFAVFFSLASPSLHLLLSLSLGDELCAVSCSVRKRGAKATGSECSLLVYLIFYGSKVFMELFDAQYSCEWSVALAVRVHCIAFDSCVCVCVRIYLWWNGV